MRDFEMRMEEIQRRSERIRARRKHRRRIAAVCVPVLFCLGLYTAVAVLPEKEQKPVSSGLGPMGTTTGPVTGGFSSDVIADERNLAVERVEISCQGVSISVSDSERVLSVVKALDSFSGLTDESKYSLPAAGGNLYVSPESECRSENAENFGTADSALAGYTIALYMQEGTVTVYYLNGNKLCVVGTQKAAVLSNEQLEELKEILEAHLP